MPDDDRAQRRWMIIQLARLIGVGAVVIGVLITQRRIEAPLELGYVVAVVGLVSAFVMPIVLARRWRTPQR